MNPTILSILLWIPFCVSLLVCGLIFCINGYRKGLIRAAISLAATIVATVLALLFANLLASLLSTGGTANALSIALSVIKRPLLSLFFFWLLTPVLTIIFRCVAGKILKDRFMPHKTWQKVLGMVVGLVCAVTFSLFWLSPLYGSVAMAGDLAEAMLETADSNDPQTQQLLKAASGHPVVAVSKAGPVDWVYRGTARVGSGTHSLSVSSMLESSRHCLALFSDFAGSESETARSEALSELVDYMRTDVINQPWFYHLYKSVLSTLQKNIATLEKAPVAESYRPCLVLMDENGDGEGYYRNYYIDDSGNFLDLESATFGEAAALETIFVDEDDDGNGVYLNINDLPYEIIDESAMLNSSPGMVSIFSSGFSASVPAEIKQVLPFYLDALETLDVDQQTFASNMNNLFGFLSRSLDKGLLSIMEEGDLQKLQDAGIIADAGQLANSTNEAVAVKQVIIASFLLSKTDNGLTVMEKYEFPMVTDPQQQAQEAELLLQIMLGENISLGEFVSRHPSLGAPAFLELAKEQGLSQLCGLVGKGQMIYELLCEQDPQLESRIIENSREFTGDTNNPSARTLCRALCYVVCLTNEYDLSYSDPGSAAVGFAVDYFGAEPPVLTQRKASAEIMYRILQSYPEACPDYAVQPESYYSPLNTLSILLEYMLQQQDSDFAEYSESEVWIYASWHMDYELTTTLVKNLVDTKGNDPLQISSTFDQNARTTLSQAFDQYMVWYDPLRDYEEILSQQGYVEEDENGQLYFVLEEGDRYPVTDTDRIPEALAPSEDWLQNQRMQEMEKLDYLVRFLGF